MAWFRTGGGGIPASLKTDMNSVLNKKLGTETTYNPDSWAPTVNLLGKLPEATKSGTVVHFADGADGVPIKSLVCEIQENLEGVSSVEVAQTGKNLIVLSDEFYNQNQNCSWQYTDSGIEITASTVLGYARIAFVFDVKQGQTYTFSYKGYSDSNYRRVQLNSSVAWSGFFYNQQLTDTETEYRHTFTAQSNILFVAFYLTTDVYMGTMTIEDLQLEIGATATDYEPYLEPTTYTVPLDSTVYGGHVDFISGLLTVEYVNFELDTLVWQGGNVGGTYCWNVNMAGNNLKLPENGSVFDGVCDTYTPIRFNGISANINTIALRNNGVLYVNNDSTTITPTGKVTIALETPLIIQLSQREIQTLYGDNTIWNDAGDTAVTYRRDIELALQSGPALMMMARPPLMQQNQENAEEVIEPEETEDDSN